MLSALVGRRERNLVALASMRRRLVQQSLAAETRERRRLAQALHDDAIQNLLLARQEVADQARGIAGASGRALAALDETHRQLREEVFAMHPVGLERAGLAAVLRSCATEAGRRGHFDANVSVDPAASGPHDDLVLASARELLANAARHSRAEHVEVTVRADDGWIHLTVADDGRGFLVEQLEQALAAGHIGLPSVTERVRAVGGRVEIDAAEGRGATIRARIPRSLDA
jgi:two-component system NarL family sensor kinase